MHVDTKRAYEYRGHRGALLSILDERARFARTFCEDRLDGGHRKNSNIYNRDEPVEVPKNTRNLITLGVASRNKSSVIPDVHKIATAEVDHKCPAGEPEAPRLHHHHSSPDRPGRTFHSEEPENRIEVPTELYTARLCSADRSERNVLNTIAAKDLNRVVNHGCAI